MNKRIEELAEQATEEMDQEAFSEDMNIPAEWYQKFAELIVKECLEMMGNNISGTFDSDWDFDTQVKYVKKHFGVEE